MSTTRNLLGALGLGAATLIGGNAEASCLCNGKVLYSYGRAAGANDYGYYYITPSTTGVPTYVCYVRINGDDDRAADILSAALADGQQVRASGDASSCPTTGTYRYGGNLVYAYAYNQY